jgi:hypothetical protein
MHSDKNAKIGDYENDDVQKNTDPKVPFLLGARKRSANAASIADGKADST